jgi:hypothetical protein
VTVTNPKVAVTTVFFFCNSQREKFFSWIFKQIYCKGRARASRENSPAG